MSVCNAAEVLFIFPIMPTVLVMQWVTLSECACSELHTLVKVSDPDLSQLAKLSKFSDPGSSLNHSPRTPGSIVSPTPPSTFVLGRLESLLAKIKQHSCIDSCIPFYTIWKPRLKVVSSPFNKKSQPQKAKIIHSLIKWPHSLIRFSHEDDSVYHCTLQGKS